MSYNKHASQVCLLLAIFFLISSFNNELPCIIPLWKGDHDVNICRYWLNKRLLSWQSHMHPEMTNTGFIAIDYRLFRAELWTKPVLTWTWVTGWLRFVRLMDHRTISTMLFLSGRPHLFFYTNGFKALESMSCTASCLWFVEVMNLLGCRFQWFVGPMRHASSL